MTTNMTTRDQHSEVHVIATNGQMASQHWSQFSLYSSDGCVIKTHLLGWTKLYTNINGYRCLNYPSLPHQLLIILLHSPAPSFLFFEISPEPKICSTTSRPEVLMNPSSGLWFIIKQNQNSFYSYSNTLNCRVSWSSSSRRVTRTRSTHSAESWNCFRF